MEIKQFYITFGVQYREGGVNHPQGMTGDGYATIEATSMEQARDIAFLVFDDWAFAYREQPGAETYPAGELFRVAMITPEVKAEVKSLVRDTLAAADGDSNDEEIAVLQDARDVLASVAGVKL